MRFRDIDVNTYYDERVIDSCSDRAKDVLLGRTKGRSVDTETIKEIVTGLELGKRSWASIEKYSFNKGGCPYRLRFTFRNNAGKTIRKNLPIPDEATADWVKDYIVRARMEREEYKKQEFIVKTKEKYGEDADVRFENGTAVVFVTKTINI